MDHDSNAISGYCCSGVNHVAGNGPFDNGDCLIEAIEAQTSNTHSCVVLTTNFEGNNNFSI